MSLNLNSILKITDKCFNILGINFEAKSENNSKSLIQKAKSVILKYYSTFVLSNCVLCIIAILTSLLQNLHQFRSVSKSFFLVNIGFVHLTKTFIIIFNKGQIFEIKEKLNVHCMSNESEKYKKEALKLFRMYQLVCIRLYAFTLSLSLLKAISSTINDSSKRTLTYDIYSPFDYQKLWIYIILQLWLEYNAINILICHISNDGLFYGLVLTISSELNALGDAFENVNVKSSFDDVEKLIKKYLNLLDICKNLESIFTLFNCLTFSNYSFLFCFIILQYISDHSHWIQLLNQILNLFLFSVLNYLCCFYCQKLQTANSLIVDKIILSKGYETKNRDIRRALFLTILKAKQPIKLTTLRFTIISMETFKNVSSVFLRECLKMIKKIFPYLTDSCSWLLICFIFMESH